MALVRSLRLACRGLARSPALALTLVFTVAVGAGGNAALFAFIRGLAEHQAQVPDPVTAERFARTAALLTWMSVLILALSCATVTALLLARATARVRDMAVRIAIGASRGSVLGMHVADMVVVIVAGGALAAVVAYWTSRLFPLLFFVEDADQLAMRADPMRLAAAGGVALAALLVAALVPAVFAHHRDPSVVLRREGPGVSPALQRLRSRLVGAQAAGCTLLVVLAVIGRIDLNRSLRTARGAALANLTVARVGVDPPIAYGEPLAGRAYLDAVEQKAVAVAGAENVAWLSLLPGSRSVGSEYGVEPPAPYTRQLDLDVRILDPDALPDSIIPAGGRVFYSTDRPGGCLVAILNEAAAERDFAGAPLGRTLQAADGHEVVIVGIVDDRTSETDLPAPAVYLDSRQVPALSAIRTPFYSKSADIVAAGSPTSGMLATVAVSPTYFDILQDPAIEGRVFDEGDDGGACGVAVISEAGAQMAFGGNAIGGALVGGGGGRAEIVGVTRAFALGIAQRPDVPWVFRPFAQSYQPRSALVVRGDDLERRLDEAIATVPNGSELEPASSLQAFLLRTALAPERIASALVTVCALLALALSVAGLQGAMTDHVARRKRELAVRLAMGARPPHLAAGILGHGWRLVLGGTVVGLAASAIMLPVLGLNPGLDTLSGATTVAASVGAALAALAGLVAIACALPVWRAIAVDARTVLQSE